RSGDRRALRASWSDDLRENHRGPISARQGFEGGSVMISSLRFASGPLAGFTFLVIVGALAARPALADTVKAEISTPLPTYKVLSNGSSYHQVQGNIGSVAFSVTADAEVA